MIWNPYVVLSSERPDMQAPVTKGNISAHEFFLPIAAGVTLSSCVLSVLGTLCLRFRAVLNLISHCLAHTVPGNFLWILWNFCSSWCSQTLASPCLLPCWAPFALYNSFLLCYFILLCPPISWSCLPSLPLRLHPSSRLLFSLLLLIPHHVRLGLSPPAPHNKTMMDLITSCHSNSLTVSLSFFFSLNFALFLGACLYFCVLSVSLSPFFPPLSLLWWPGEYAYLQSICPADKDVSSDGCSTRHRAAGPCQCWSVLGDG